MSERDKTREKSDRESGRADTPVYVTLSGDARKLDRSRANDLLKSRANGSVYAASRTVAVDGPACFILRGGQPTTARERRGEGLQPGEVEANTAPRVQTVAPARETVRLTAQQRADREVREAAANAMRRLRKLQLARAGLLGIGD